MGKPRSKQPTGADDLPSSESGNDLDDIFDTLCDDIDGLGYDQTKILTKGLNAMKKKYHDCSDELENAFLEFISRERYGTGWSAYIKQQIIRPIQRKYRKK